MAGKANEIAVRMAVVAEDLATQTERGVAALKAVDTPTDAAGVDRFMRATRAGALAGRGVLALAVDAERVLATAEDEESDEDDGEEELDDAGLEALRQEVERRYARFDQVPCGTSCGDLGHARGAAAGGQQRLGHPGARASAAA